MGIKVERLCNSGLHQMFEEVTSRGITTDIFELKAFAHRCKLSNSLVNILVFSDDNEYHYIIFEEDTKGILCYSDSFDTMESAMDFAIDTADNKY